MQLNSHLHFSGQCEEAFKFYEKCLGGKIDGLFRYEGAPGAEGQRVPAEWRNKVMHAHMTVGDQALMGMDAPPERFHKPQGFHVNSIVGKGQRRHAVRSDFLVARVRHARGSLRHAVDGQLRTSRLIFVPGDARKRAAPGIQALPEGGGSEENSYAKNYPVLVVRRQSRGGNEFLCLRLQEFKGWQGYSVWRGRARTEGDRNVRDISPRWAVVLRTERWPAIHFHAGYIVLREL